MQLLHVCTSGHMQICGCANAISDSLRGSQDPADLLQSQESKAVIVA